MTRAATLTTEERLCWSTFIGDARLTAGTCVAGAVKPSPSVNMLAGLSDACAGKTHAAVPEPLAANTLDSGRKASYSTLTNSVQAPKRAPLCNAALPFCVLPCCAVPQHAPLRQAAP